ncbi:hypothetical protein L249_8840 [Ophiocordyceps polyrhachis-furcata BCC 54312]|uniref:Extracellular membrane protein CFEM domain-containing protein n=1 Tax=Ophiocordyceps polyrhachis-furcata BCC 54312 TaxID=1330021 RepID=A0A367L264_9HYPO|nr:hypothetical protein L249_8840 [Ophiocordyceps polyrhachis-furcata BCC 54312]
MKLLLPLTLLATVAGVSAQEKCDADYIVEACLSSERAKVEVCSPTDYDCLCAAHGAVATCYNNCPNDQRASSARQAVRSNCQNASMYGSKAHASKTSSMSPSSTSDTSATPSDSASTTEGVQRAASSTSTSTARPSSSGAAEALSGNTGGLFVAVAGALVALL